MYNRYVPAADGSYRRQLITGQNSAPQPASEPQPACIPTPTHAEHREKSLLTGLSLDTGDILVLLILLLVLFEGEDTDPMSILITLAAFFILQ